MNRYTLSDRFLNGNVHRCVFAKNRPVSLKWSDYTIITNYVKTGFRENYVVSTFMFCKRKIKNPSELIFSLNLYALAFLQTSPD